MPRESDTKYTYLYIKVDEIFYETILRVYFWDKINSEIS